MQGDHDGGNLVAEFRNNIQLLMERTAELTTQVNTARADTVAAEAALHQE
jgi:hypothetical protein